MSSNLRILFFLIFSFLILTISNGKVVLAASEVFADKGGNGGVVKGDEDNDDDIVGKKLCNIVKMLTGSTAKAIATTAIFFLGIGFFFGRVTWGVGAVTAVGIIMIFSGNAFINAIAGSEAAKFNCTT